MRRRFRFSIRRQLVLISIAVLSLPYSAYDYVREMETFLREGLEISLAGDASRFAGLMLGQAEVFPQPDQLDQRSLFIHPINQVVQLDAYTEDWEKIFQWAEVFQSDDQSLTTRVLIAEREGSHYLLFHVLDDQLIYQSPGSPFSVEGDQIELFFHDADGDRHHWWIAPSAPGQVGVYAQSLIWDEAIWEPRPVMRDLTNVSAVWQEFNLGEQTGYTVEVRLPDNIFVDDLGFQVFDIDQMSEQILKEDRPVAAISSFSQENPQQLNRLIRSSDSLNRALSGHDITAGRRLWVLDSAGNVLATRGSLKNPQRRQALNRFYRLILPAVDDRFTDDLQGASRLQGEEVIQALEGKSALRWRSSIDEQAAIVSSAQPIMQKGKVIGAVLVEETTGNLQMVQRKALAKLFLRTLLIFAFVTVLLLFFSARLSQRIRRLNQDAEQAIDPHGRVISTQVGKPWVDELGDLSDQYSSMLARLNEHHEYLESLASKLSHELRTPMAVVQSSLENLKQAEGEEVATYLQRAQDGMARLERLTVRLSEAANLDQALQSAETQSFDLLALLRQLTTSYQNTYSDQRIQFENKLSKQEQLVINGSPDLIVQMIDKLLSNALDFASENTPVVISLSSQESADSIRIIIENTGQAFDQSLLDRSSLPDRFISKRSGKQDRTVAHLGMGLYIAARIARFHNGTLRAENEEGKVRLIIELPQD